MDYGLWHIGDFLTFKVGTRDSSTGQATDADAPPPYRIYKDQTAEPIVTGDMALFDSDDLDGIYSGRVELLAGPGFEKGKTYHIIIPVTVNGVTDNEIHTFQIIDPADYMADVTNLSTYDPLLDEVTVGSLTAPSIQSIWDALTSAFTTEGSIGKLLKEMLDAAISSCAKPADILREWAPGMGIKKRTITDGHLLTYTKDVNPFTGKLGSEWDLTGKDLYICVKKKATDLDATAIINAKCTITDLDERIWEFTPTSVQTSKAGLYKACELKIYDTGTSNSPETAERFKLTIENSVRDGD